MRVLLDTNIIIYREADRIVFREIGDLFYWLDRLHYEKYVHPLSIQEIEGYHDSKVVATFKTKINSYNILKTQSPESPEIQAIRNKYDTTQNDSIDTSLLKEVFSDRVELLITEDKKLHEKANELGISHRVFKINGFLEKVVAENPDLVDYKVLSVKKEYFGNIGIDDPFFDSFKVDYQGFDKWFAKKSEEIAYVSKGDNGNLLAFLYVKREDENEIYKDIQPTFQPKRRLKIGTFKVAENGYKLGERFLKIIFDNALELGVAEIYVTIFDRTPEQQRLIELVEEWGFKKHGIKQTPTGDEQVFVRDFVPKIDVGNPKFTYPYFAHRARKFIVPIYPEYHTELFPDSILRTESKLDFVESRPNRNAIRKVYISRSIERNLRTGDIIVFYRTKGQGPAYHTSVITTIGVVQNVKLSIKDINEFIGLCKRRSVFTDQQLIEQWNYKPGNRPFVVNFLYVMTLPTKLNLNRLLELKIIAEPPRGFERLSDASFDKLMENSNADQRFIVD